MRIEAPAALPRAPTGVRRIERTGARGSRRTEYADEQRRNKQQSGLTGTM